MLRRALLFIRDYLGRSAGARGKVKTMDNEGKPGKTSNFSSGLFKFGLFIVLAGTLLLVLRLILGEHSTLGIISNLLIIFSGMVLAWKPFMNRRKQGQLSRD